MKHLSLFGIALLFCLGLSACVTETPDQPLPAPRLLSPMNDTTNAPLGVALRWESVPGAESYTVRISEREDFVTITDSITTGVLVFMPSGLEPGKTYYWHVRAQNKAKTSVWSGTRRLSTNSSHRIPGVGSTFGYEVEDSLTTYSWTLELSALGATVAGRSNVAVFLSGQDSTLLIYEPNGDITTQLLGAWQTLPFGSKVGVTPAWDTTARSSTSITIERTSVTYTGYKKVTVMGKPYDAYGALFVYESREIAQPNGSSWGSIHSIEHWYAPALGAFAEIAIPSSIDNNRGLIELKSFELK
jgi:hypothetical protein